MDLSDSSNEEPEPEHQTDSDENDDGPSPAELAAQMRARLAAKQRDIDALPHPWVERVSQSTGDAYYFNLETEESTYDRPDSSFERPQAQAGASGTAQSHRPRRASSSSSGGCCGSPPK